MRTSRRPDPATLAEGLLQAPHLPIVPRVLNAAGHQLARAGLQLGTFEPDVLVASARRRTHLRDLGDEGFREALERLTRSLSEEARLSPLGRLLVREELRRNLENRLRLHDWHARHQQIARERIRSPIIIVGQGSTGTTTLHELMALDPANRVPQSWEAERPCPPPERTSYASDPRIEYCQRQIDRSERLIPDFKRIHRMGARLPQECVRLTSTEFASLIFSTMWRVPRYARWLLEQADMRPVYSAHRRVLQLLQWRCPGECWVLKSPGHLWHLDALLAEYPDARLVQTHRDPLAVLSALTSRELVIRAMSSDRAEAHDIAREWARWNAWAYERSVRFRERSRLPSSQTFDLHFLEFTADPLAQVRRIYAHFDLELPEDVAAHMRAYLSANPKDRDGHHRHRFEETGLDPDRERERVRRYQSFFGVESEVFPETG